MIYPPYLQPGDRVAIVAPARKISPSEIDAAVRLLRSWQLEVVLPEHLFDSDNQFAGPDNIRALTLQQQLDDPSIRAILCARGGYGTARIIDQLDFSRFRVLLNLGTYGGYRLSTDKEGGFDQYDQRMDYGVIGGGGFAVVFNPLEFHIEANYKYALASMYHTNKISDIYWIYTYPQNVMISASLFVHLW